MFREKMDLRTKILVLPFTEYEFFKEDIFQKLAKASDTGEYSRIFEQDFTRVIYPILNRTNKINSLAEIKLLMRRFYSHQELSESSNFGKCISPFYLQYLTRLSRFFLTHRDGKITFKYWESQNQYGVSEMSEESSFLGPYKGNQKVAMWNSLNRTFTTDLLVILYLLSNGMTDEFYLGSYHAAVSLADPQLEQILSQGVAETHLHLSAGGNFAVTWQRLMSPERNTYFPKKNYVLNDQVIQKGIPLQSSVQAMVLVRILLAQFLHAKEIDPGLTPCIEGYFKDSTFGGTNDSVLEFLFDVEKGDSLASYENLYDSWYQGLLSYLGLTNYRDTEPGDWKKEFGRQDVIHLLVNPFCEFNTVEMLFLFKSMRYMIEQLEQDSLFHQLFWQYIRIKNEVFQCYIETNSIRGLDNFLGYYERATQNAEWGLILHQQLENTYLHKVEVRISPGWKKNKNEIKKELALNIASILTYYLKNLQQMDSSRYIPELGVIIHFIKRNDEFGIEKCWLDYNPFQQSEHTGHLRHPNHTKLYYRQLQEEYLMQMEVIRDFREEIPDLSEYIVGIDAAGSEFDTEPWVFAPIYRAARDSKTNKILHNGTLAKRIRNLGFTYHAGEDFLHMLSGLRRIHEVVEHFQFHAGDRIGHGMALGISPDLWALRNPVVILPRIEYLENLLWVWGLHRNREPFQIDTAHLEHEIMELANQIYKRIDGITIFDLWRAYQRKFKTFEVSEEFNPKSSELSSRIFCKYVESHSVWNVEKLTHAQHCKCYLEPMIEPIQVEILPIHMGLIRQIQSYVRSTLSRQGIVIETNPTSNTAIGEIESIFLHYIQDLNQRGLKMSQMPDNGLMVTINSDDPVIFNTNINNEFSYIFYALVDKGYAREDILEWVNQVRQQGLRSSFVQQRNLSREERITEIENLVEQLKKHL